ncbi:MAG: hypothetical protein KTR22_12990 [Flavobacteriaceae bacterium]|nr:hypothetical protein [Flavobacteriaceae bacterium]
MRPFRLLFDFYINASIHVAVAVCSLVVLIAKEYTVPISEIVLGIVFFGTITGYNFIKYARIAGLHHRSLADSLKTIQVFSFLCAGFLLYLLVLMPVNLWAPLLILGVLTFLYAVPFIRRKSLRTLYGIKIFVVGLVWSSVTVLFPLWGSNLLGQTDIWISFTQILLLVIVWTLPFEIRDMMYDSPKLGTLPQRLGILGVKLLGISLMVLTLVLEGFKDEYSTSHFLGLLSICVVSGVLLGLAQKKQPKYYASFLVESIPIVWVVLDIVLRRLFG